MNTNIKNIFKASVTTVLTLLLAFVFGPMAGMAQEAVQSFDPGKGVDADTYANLTSFTQGIDWVFGFLVIVTGYLSKYIPFIKSINQGVYRVLAVAVVLGAGFFFGAGTNLITLLITYTVSTSFYEVVLKLLKGEKNTPVV